MTEPVSYGHPLKGGGTAVRDSDELTVIRGLAQASSSMAYPHQGDGASAAPIA
jgi:hypothetical protein